MTGPPPPLPGTPQAPTYATPTTRKNSSSSCLLAALLGCGGVALIVIVMGFFAGRTLFKGGTFKGIVNQAMTSQSNAAKLQNLSVAIDQYRAAHKAYPKSLTDLVPRYVTPDALRPIRPDPQSKSEFEYTAPTPGSAPDAIMVTLDAGSMNLMKVGSTRHSMDMRTYIRLLRDGRIVQDQVTRSTLR